ncbi:MAG: 2-methoxy-6-polyprenyl-1,4-benzoquinol methylase, mitochondrial [Chlamydiia bacterium]|nr:2-methoxy-6-polyprenyl-1,4-benzoquinol methylase, mitochondrial [Chlamydiia bacterium]MCH9615859.1 2-methoxy-6-polyprenyl-1,4-benzoquinol methylase, mitochondrial [Chlamydiia bacterium]MCH9628738.1 2-methoxy-6-polyprenyl-1,4-benzoquinol methylase, mitochondrial [Chlamydiia bacterium]
MAKEIKKYFSQTEKCPQTAKEYSGTEDCLFRYLGYRDIPKILSKYCSKGKALDYGCGTGISTTFLVNLGYDSWGVDVSLEMLDIARGKLPGHQFSILEGKQLPFEDEEFELVFSSFVLFELSSLQEITNYLAEGRRVLKPGGVFVVLTGNEGMYTSDWKVMNTNFPENKNLQSGSLAKISLPESGMEFSDYYWTQADYKQSIEMAQLKIIDTHFPLGYEEEEIEWHEELTTSPYVLYILGC